MTQMRHKLSRLMITPTLAVLFGCGGSGGDDIVRPSGDGWLIPFSLLVSGGVTKDGIPTLNNPAMIPAAQVDYLDDDALVTGLVVNGEPRAYPYAVTDWHETINEDFPNNPLTLSYCPLTGTAIAFERTVAGQVLNFGVSGLLFNNNLIMFDRATDSHWPQMRLQCDQGELVGTKLKTYPVIETKWSTWKKLFPNTVALSTDTGFDRNYNAGGSVYAQAGYSSTFAPPWFNITHEDNRLPPKQKVHGVLVGEGLEEYEAKAYVINPSRAKRVLNDRVATEPIVVIDDGPDHFLVSFSRIVNGSVLTFRLPENSDGFPFTIRDNETESTWNVFGEAIEGQLVGAQLEPTKSYNAYWFAWATFQVGSDIFED